MRKLFKRFITFIVFGHRVFVRRESDTFTLFNTEGVSDFTRETLQPGPRKRPLEIRNNPSALPLRKPLGNEILNANL